VDGAVPAGNSVAAYVSLYLGRLTGNPELEERGEQAVYAGLSAARDHPEACTHLLSALDFLLGPGRELVIAGASDDPLAREMLDIARNQFQPALVTVFYPSGRQKDELARLIPFLKTLPDENGQAKAHLCERFACRSAITEAGELRRTLNS